MPPKGSKKTPVDVPDASDPLLPSGDPASGTSNGKDTEQPASGSGLSVAEKAAMSSLKQQDDDFIDDDSDDELELDITCDLLARIRYTAILLVPFFLQPELGSVILTVRTLLKKVWSSALSPGAADGAKIQILQPAFVARTKYCRLQLSLLREDDIVIVRQKVVDYQRLTRLLLIPVILYHILTSRFHVAAASLRTSPLVTPLLQDPAIAFVSTGCNREEWICTQIGCGKAKGKSFMTAADHVAAANHLIQLEKIGTATRVTMDKAVLAPLRKDYGM
ncbi:unnamed protein product [Closterium sp. Naga37s-1]|nr:unnamed protein product [Closterium sp. Naga37s-1]